MNVQRKVKSVYICPGHVPRRLPLEAVQVMVYRKRTKNANRTAYPCLASAVDYISLNVGISWLWLTGLRGLVQTCMILMRAAADLPGPQKDAYIPGHRWNATSVSCPDFYSDGVFAWGKKKKNTHTNTWFIPC